MTKLYSHTKIIALATSLACLTSVATAGTLDGAATYLDRRAVPPGAILEVQLVDVSRADAASITMSSKRLALDHVPFGFSLEYDDALIDQQMSYAVQAVMVVDGQQIYRNTTAYPALTRGAPDFVEVTMDRIAQAPAASASLIGPSWTVVEMYGQQIEAESPPTLRFMDGGLIAAHSGCNRFRGGVALNGTHMKFDEAMAGTLMACPPPYDRIEPAFVGALGTVARFDITGNDLTLLDSQDVVLLRLEAEL